MNVKNTIPETPTTYKRGERGWQEFVTDVEDYASDCTDDSGDTRKMALVGSSELRYMSEQENNLFPGKTLVVEERRQLTRRAFGQLNERLSGPPFQWLSDEERCGVPLRANVFHEVLKDRDGQTVMLRHQGRFIRAILSTEYSTFNHTEFLDMIGGSLSAMGEAGGNVTVHNPLVGDEMKAFVLLPRITFGSDPEAGGGLHPAIYISNSEVGTGKLRLTGGVFRTVCSNGLIMGWAAKGGLQIVHRHINKQIFASQIAGQLEIALTMSEAATQKFIQSQAILMDNTKLKTLSNRWAAKYGLTLTDASEWELMVRHEAELNGRGENVTLFDVVNGATYLAHSKEPVEAEILQRMAGDLLEADVMPYRQRRDY